MFPIPWNKAFRKKDGTVVNIADAMSGGGGGSDLPEHSIADAGKVLTVADDGSLEWDEAGAGGGDEVILDYFEDFISSSGAHSYTNTITISEAGTYMILIGGFLTTATVKINDVTQSNTFDDSGAFVHYYHESQKELSAGDVIDISLSSSGKTLFVSNIVKLGSEE